MARARFSGPVGLAAAVLLAVFVVGLVHGNRQASGTRALVPEHYPTRFDETTPDEVPLKLVRPGFGHRMLVMRQIRDRSGAGEVRPTLRAELPFTANGYWLHVAIQEYNHEWLPAVEVSVGDRAIWKVPVRADADGNWLEPDVVRCRIPAAQLNVDGPTVLSLANHGGGLKAHVLLVPCGPLGALARWAVPLSGFPLLALCVISLAGRRERLLQAGLGLIVFAVYVSTFWTHKLAPIGGFAQDDAYAIGSAVLANEMTFDMSKHMLFLPLMHGLFWGIEVVGTRPMYALVVAFALLGAVNVVLADRCVATRVPDPRARGLLVMLYASSFCVWYFGSIFETYTLSTLLATTFLLWYLQRPMLISWRAGAMGAAAVAGAGLAHAPLIILVVPFAYACATGRDGWRRAALSTLLALGAAGVLYAAGEALLGAVYGAVRHGNPYESVSYGVDRVTHVLGLYADADHLSLSGLGSLVLGQFYFAMCGVAYGLPMESGLGAVFHYRHEWCTGLAFAGLSAWWVTAAVGLSRRPTLARGPLLCGGLVLVTYMAFFWWFNPSEMFLYSAPLLLPLLLLATGGVQAVVGARLSFVLLVLAPLLLWVNVQAMNTRF